MQLIKPLTIKKDLSNQQAIETSTLNSIELSCRMVMI